MSDADFVSAFSASSEEDKRENFEQSTLKLVLKQLGMSAKKVQYLSEDLGPEFTFDWFNYQQYISPLVLSDRCFRFNVKDIFLRPSKSPVVEMYDKATVEHDDNEPICLIFKCYDIGRLIATNIKLTDYTHVHVNVRGIVFNVVPFAGFFSERYGDIIEEA